MKKLLQSKNKATWLLLTGILVLCAGFIATGCGIGTGPQFKVQDPDAGQYAIDFTKDCPIGAGACSAGFSRIAAMDEEDQLSDINQENGKPLTLEAWIKPKANANGTVLKRGDDKKGALLQARATSTPNSIIPRFEIRRVQSDGTTSAPYSVDGTLVTINSAWVHIAGVLTNANHSAVGGHPACTDVAVTAGDPHVPDGSALNDPWHLDLYQDGILTACSVTYGDGSDDTFAAEAHAAEPDALTAAPGVFLGIIDEARIWTVARSVSQMDACRRTELSQSPGTCSWNDDDNNMILYIKFNEGHGHGLSDFTGTFSGGLEYPIGGGLFDGWHTGWTHDTPF